LSQRSLSVAGHFGELLQGRLGPDGPVALVTLPCPTLRVTLTARRGAFALHQPDGRAVPLAEARRLVPHDARLTLRVPMPLGGGAGVSTAARVALLRLGGMTDPAELAAACHALEGATDPLMFPDPARLLWASRQGRALAPLPPLPRFDIIGGFFGPPRRTNPADMHFSDISDLVALWPAACAHLPDMARLATESARRCLALRGPAGDPTPVLAARLGALGWTMAHTGSARGLIFSPGTVPDAALSDLRAAGFSTITRFGLGG
jgi:uncharacterized protein involved in propanediol utilization